YIDVFRHPAHPIGNGKSVMTSDDRAAARGGSPATPYSLAESIGPTRADTVAMPAALRTACRSSSALGPVPGSVTAKFMPTSYQNLMSPTSTEPRSRLF